MQRPTAATARAALLVRALLASGALATTVACTERAPAPGEVAAAPALPAARTAAPPNPLRDAFFGDLHVHTAFSTDAYLAAVRSTPDDAYRYARGEPIRHPGGFEVRLDVPLDFLAVTDHGEGLGVRHLAAGAAGEEERSRGRAASPPGKEERAALHRDAWQEVMAAADRHYDPGRLTTFIGYEYSSAPDRQSLHRNVIFRGAGPELPFTRDDSPDPEDLWAWLDTLRAAGVEALAIPHNPNASNGLMFEPRTRSGAAIDADYADRRNRNEPLVEVTQSKGSSETHPALSPLDEWASYELVPFRIGGTVPSQPKGSYLRDAYRAGLEMEEALGFNPWKLGMIGSSDSHNGAGSYDEASFFSIYGTEDDDARERGSVPRRRGWLAAAEYSAAFFRLWSAAGLAGVWAEENTRESIYDALRRKETFATSGPRIRVRFFAGYDFPADLPARGDAVALAYANGVTMGADLLARTDRTPSFFVWAMRDARSAPLQRLQVIKGWVEGGESRERVIDVACSDGLEPESPTAGARGEPAAHGGAARCPDNGAAVDLEDCSVRDGRGAAELAALWTDPDYASHQRAFYYVRVLENPTCRWSTWDAVRAGVEPNPDLPPTIQERAWTSPIWIVP